MFYVILQLLDLVVSDLLGVGEVDIHEYHSSSSLGLCDLDVHGVLEGVESSLAPYPQLALLTEYHVS